MRKCVPIIENLKLNEDYFILSIEDKDLRKNTLPGNFFEIMPRKNYTSLLRKPISVYRVFADKISFMIKNIGPGTNQLSKLKKGDLLDVIGPLGNTFNYNNSKKVLFVSGGIGYAPLVYLHEEILQGNNITWIHGGRTSSDIFEKPNIIYTDDGSAGKKGFVTEGMRNALNGDNFDQIFCCGPDIMMKKCVAIAKEFNTPIQVSLEAYMACGVGVCKGCVTKIKITDDSWEYKLVCKDGPVFNGYEVMWDE